MTYDIFISADMSFGIHYNTRTDTADTPVMYRVKNAATKGISMCTWYKLSQDPEPYPRSLFQYVIEQRVEGFQVWLHSSPIEKLDIHFGGSHSLDIPFPIKGKAWTHLCLVWNQGRYLFKTFKPSWPLLYINHFSKLILILPAQTCVSEHSLSQELNMIGD